MRAITPSNSYYFPNNHRSSFYMHSLALTLIFIINNGVDSSLCRNYNNIQNDAAVAEATETSDQDLTFVEYNCPRSFDPTHFSDCCSSDGKPGCCGQARYFYEIEKTLAMGIAITVTSICVAITIIISICCFCSQCPLYSSCRTQYTHDIATYVSKDLDPSDYVLDMETMPQELSGRRKNKFSPIAISNGNLPLGVEVDVM